MKKQTKIIIGIVLAIAVIILVVSLIYPPVFKGLTSGTFGKADKYHKVQMTEKDIQLRSEFVQDTAQLRSMIQGLIYFSLFSQNMSYTIDTCVKSFHISGICNEKNNACENISILEDYSTFIKNNTKTLNSTVRMLTDFYLKDTTDQAVDVEKNLRDFGNFVTQLNDRDSVVENALYAMDGYLLSPKMREIKKTELSELKSIRDQLLMKGVQLAGLLQDKPLCSSLISYALTSQLQFAELTGLVYVAAQELQMIKNSSELTSYVGSHSVSMLPISALGLESQLKNAVIGRQDLSSKLIGSALVYDKPTLCFFLYSGEQYGKIVSSSLKGGEISSNYTGAGQIGTVAYMAQDGLKLVQSAFDLKNVYSSMGLGSVLKSGELDRIISAQNLGSFSVGDKFVGMYYELGSMGYMSLGVTSDR
ncbi:MAG: hypothetical protein WCO93_06535 [bacterium]